MPFKQYSILFFSFLITACGSSNNTSDEIDRNQFKISVNGDSVGPVELFPGENFSLGWTNAKEADIIRVYFSRDDNLSQEGGDEGFDQGFISSGVVECAESDRPNCHYSENLTLQCTYEMDTSLVCSGPLQISQGGSPFSFGIVSEIPAQLYFIGEYCVFDEDFDGCDNYSLPIKLR